MGALACPSNEIYWQNLCAEKNLSEQEIRMPLAKLTQASRNAIGLLLVRASCLPTELTLHIHQSPYILIILYSLIINKSNYCLQF